MNEAADRVRRERLRRGWSVRDASRVGGISNTYWGAFEDYRQPLTPTIAEAVAKAFEWPASWADEGVSPPLGELAELQDRVAALERLAEQHDRAIDRLLGAGQRRRSTRADPAGDADAQ